MPATSRLERFLSSAINAAAALGAACFPLLILVILWDVITRKLLTYYPAASEVPIFTMSTTLQELEWHLHSALFLFALGYTYLKDGHVRIDVFWAGFEANTKKIIELFAIVAFLLPFAGVAIYFGARLAYFAFASGEASASSTGLSQRWIVKSLLPIGFVLFAMSGIARACRSISTRPSETKGERRESPAEPRAAE